LHLLANNFQLYQGKIEVKQQTASTAAKCQPNIKPRNYVSSETMND